MTMKRWMQVLAVSMAFAMPLPAVLADEAQDREVKRQVEAFDDYLAAGNGQMAMQTFMTLKAKHPNHVLVKTYEGKVLMLQNNAQGAQAALAAALELEPHHPVASALMANLEFRTFKVEEARKRVNEALEKHPDSPELLQISADMYMAQEKNDEARKIWVQLLEIKDLPKPIAQAAHAQYGTILAKDGQHQQAADHLKQALDINWHVGVAMAYVQELDKAGADKATIKQAVDDLRRRIEAAKSHPQYAQVKQQVDQQLAPIEAKLKASEVEQKLEALASRLKEPGAKDKTFSQSLEISSIRALIKQVTTAPAQREKQLHELARLEMLNRKLALEEAIEKKFAPESRMSVAKEVLNLAQGQSGPEVEAAVKLANEQIAETDKILTSQADAALGLARSGWTFDEMINPSSEQAKTLEEKGLPNSYRQFPALVKYTLKAHYQALADKREKLEVEPAIKAYLESPGDPALRAKIITLTKARIKDMDPADASITSFSVIPRRVWVEELPSGLRMDLPRKAYDAREKSYSLWNDVKSFNLKRNHNWARLIQDLQRVDKTYPRWAVAHNRVLPHAFLGQYQQAHDDAVMALAVLCWERANTQGIQETGNTEDQTRQSLAAIKVLDELARNKPTTAGRFPSAPFQGFINAIRLARHGDAVEYLLAEHEENSIDSQVLDEVKFQLYRKELLDALAQAYLTSNNPDRKQKIREKAKSLYSYSNPAWCVIDARENKDPEKQLALWRSVVSYDPMNVQGNLEQGKALEKEGKRTEAMLAYNVAANGQEADKLTGLAKEAATARDRLEGPTPDLNTVAKIYQDIASEKYKAINANTSNKADAAILVAITNRIAARGGNAIWVLGRRADAMRNLENYRQVIADAEQLIKVDAKNEGLYNAILGNAYEQLTDFPRALDCYNKAVALNYKSAVVYLRLGNIHRASGEYEKAVEHYNTVLQMDPSHVSAMLNRSEINEYIFDRDKDALKDAEQALKIQKDKNPEGQFFALELRVNNLRMKIARQDLMNALGGLD